MESTSWAKTVAHNSAGNTVCVLCECGWWSLIYNTKQLEIFRVKRWPSLSGPPAGDSHPKKVKSRGRLQWIFPLAPRFMSTWCRSSFLPMCQLHIRLPVSCPASSWGWFWSTAFKPGDWGAYSSLQISLSNWWIPASDSFGFVMWSIVLLEVAIKGWWSNCGQNRMIMVNSNTRSVMPWRHEVEPDVVFCLCSPSTWQKDISSKKSVSVREYTFILSWLQSNVWQMSPQSVLADVFKS